MTEREENVNWKKEGEEIKKMKYRRRIRKEENKEQKWMKSSATAFWSAHALENSRLASRDGVVNTNKHIINTTIATDSKFQQHTNVKNSINCENGRSWPRWEELGGR